MTFRAEIIILHKVNICVRESVFPQCFHMCWSVAFGTAFFLIHRSSHQCRDGSFLKPCNDFITYASIIPFLIIPPICLLQSIVTHCFKLNLKQFWGSTAVDIHRVHQLRETKPSMILLLPVKRQEPFQLPYHSRTNSKLYKS